MASKDPKVTMEDQPTEEGGEPHGVVNLQEAAILVHSLDEALMVVEVQVAESEERNVLGEMVAKFKEAMGRVIPTMTEADVEKVVSAIKDPSGLALRLKMDAWEELLEILMPLEDAPGTDEAMASIQGETPLNRDQQNLLREAF